MAAFAIIAIVLVLVIATQGQPGGVVGSGINAVFGDGTMIANSLLQTMANAVTNQEGQPGDRNYRNNNPGNLKPPNGSGAFWPGQTGTDPQGFAIFDSWNDGYNALVGDLGTHIQNNPDQSITDFFAQYSPDETGLSGEYGANIAAALGVSPDTLLGELGQ